MVTAELSIVVIRCKNPASLDFERYDSITMSAPTLERKQPNMLITGCDYRPGFQEIAFVDTETGEMQERRLKHREEAEQFYRTLTAAGAKLRVGDGSEWSR